MKLTIQQMALMSRLLDEALPLDEADRRRWLADLSPDYQDLAHTLRAALLPDATRSAELQSFLETPPSLEDVDANSGLLPGANVGPYVLLRSLGAGGMAEVWLARRADGAFKREVALKLPLIRQLRRDLAQRFAVERDILASLEHPNIARLYDAGIDTSGYPYLAMEYVQGQPLTDWCDAQSSGLSDRLKLFRQVLEAVRFAHEKQVIHRDLKPSNILVTQSAQVRLLDFGVAKLLEGDDADKTSLTSIYGRALTPDYASPELLRGDLVDVRSDVYSLGVLLYELLTGIRPYRLKSAASMGLLDQAIGTLEIKKPSMLAGPPASPDRTLATDVSARQLRGDLDAIALKALDREPSKRYQSAAAFAEDIESYLARKPIRARPARVTDRMYKFALRNRSAVVVAAMALAAIIVTVGYTLHRENATQARIGESAAALPVSIHAGAMRATNDASATAGPTVPERSVAVLPFVDMSEKKDQAYFADGLAEELLDLLARVPNLKVPARSSSFFFKGSSMRIRNVGHDLGVAYVLEGGVRKAGDTIRVSVQLVRADTGYQVWSDTYERNVRDIFKVQDEISAAVIDALKLRLSSPGPQIAERRTANPEAYDQYLRGKHLFQLGDYDGLLAARDAYRRAIELDPNFAPAFAGLANVEYLTVKDFSDTDQPDVIRRAMDYADHAVALAPALAEAYSERALLRLNQYDWAGAQADLQKALALDPNDVKANRRMVLVQLSLGNVVAALPAQLHVVDLDPLDMSSLEILGMSYYFADQGAEARRTFAKVRVFSPNFDGLSGNAGFSYLADGQASAARRECEPHLDDTARACLAAAEHALGHDERSQTILADLIANHPRRACYFIAKAYGFSGNSAFAFEWLDRAFSSQAKLLTDVKSEPAFRAWHGDPRYLALLRKMKLPE
jgi:TolB-like protein/Flp pilus assembly protein TadD/predicted Ser/Thr protein kinase